MRALKYLSILFIVTIAINLMWEVAHSLLYDWNTVPLMNDIYYYIPRIYLSTLGDGALIVIFALGLSWVNKGFIWMTRPTKGDYWYIVVTGIIIALVIEWYATAYSLWHYNNLMPMLFGVVGLSPFVQLALTGCLAVFLTSRLVRQS